MSSLFTVSNKLQLKRLSILLAPIALFTIALVTLSPHPAQAATVPEVCFTFSSNTITDYDIGNPDCVADVDIPNTIAGNAVTSIGGGAFYGKNLTSVAIPTSVITIDNSAFFSNQLSNVTIPNSVISIGEDVFANNYITSVTIPNSVASIGGAAFAGNILTEVMLPDSLVSLGSAAFVGQSILGRDSYPEILSGDPIRVQAALDTGWYTKLYTSNPSNPGGFTDEVIPETIFGGDINSDGDTTDSLGGHVINPAHVTISHQDAQGNTLEPDSTITGDGLSDYLVKNNPSNDPGLYYRINDSIAIDPLDIPGYASPDSVVLDLTTTETTHTFVYTPASLTYPDPITSSTVTLELPGDVTNGTVSAISPSSIPKDTFFSYPLGLTSFQFDTTIGATKTVTLYYDLPGDPSSYTARKYNTNTKTFSTITNATITRVTYNNKSMIRLTYDITDGGPLDQDNTANGTIVDPVGLAQATVGVPDTGL